MRKICIFLYEDNKTVDIHKGGITMKKLYERMDNEMEAKLKMRAIGYYRAGVSEDAIAKILGKSLSWVACTLASAQCAGYC